MQGKRLTGLDRDLKRWDLHLWKTAFAVNNG